MFVKTWVIALLFLNLNNAFAQTEQVSPPIEAPNESPVEIIDATINDTTVENAAVDQNENCIELSDCVENTEVIHIQTPAELESAGITVVENAEECNDANTCENETTQVAEDAAIIDEELPTGSQDVVKINPPPFTDSSVIQVNLGKLSVYVAQLKINKFGIQNYLAIVSIKGVQFGIANLAINQRLQVIQGSIIHQVPLYTKETFRKHQVSLMLGNYINFLKIQKEDIKAFLSIPTPGVAFKTRWGDQFGLQAGVGYGLNIPSNIKGLKFSNLSPAFQVSVIIPLVKHRR